MLTTRHHRSGMTYIEVVACLVVLSVALTAGLQSYGSFARGARSWAERSTALQLADQLMSEINTLPFADPAGSATIGLESGEVAGSRTTFDDIDDYNGWDCCPPKDRNGQVMSDYAGYRQKVTVEFDNTVAAGMGTGLPANSVKKITVRILRNNREAAKLVTWRALHVGGN